MSKDSKIFFSDNATKSLFEEKESKLSLTSTFPGHSGYRGSLGTSHWLDVPSLPADKTEKMCLLIKLGTRTFKKV